MGSNGTETKGMLVVISWDWCGVVWVWVTSVPSGLHEGISLRDTSLPTST